MLLTPTESPGKGVSWQPLGLAPAPPRGCCHVQLTLSSPSSRQNYQQLSSCQSTEPRNNMLCDVSHQPSDPGQARPTPAPALPLCQAAAAETALPASEGEKLSHLCSAEGSELAALSDPLPLQPAAEQGLVSEQIRCQKLEHSVLIC